MVKWSFCHLDGTLGLLISNLYGSINGNSGLPLPSDSTPIVIPSLSSLWSHEGNVDSLILIPIPSLLPPHQTLIPGDSSQRTPASIHLWLQRALCGMGAKGNWQEGIFFF